MTVFRELSLIAAEPQNSILRNRFFESSDLLLTSSRIPKKQSLPKEEVQVWIGQNHVLQKYSNHFKTLLSLWEQNRVLSFENESEQENLLFTYACLKKILASYLGIPAKEILPSQSLRGDWQIVGDLQKIFIDVQSYKGGVVFAFYSESRPKLQIGELVESVQHSLPEGLQCSVRIDGFESTVKWIYLK